MLSIIENFFNELNKNEVVHCHWKSNERLENFLNGDSDLDILFYETDKEKVIKIFDQIGAKKFEVIPLKKFKNIVDYFQVDKKTGKLIHYHVYFSLELGEPNVKQYIFPWIDEILSNRIKHKKLDIWIPSHEHELILLIIREGLRIPYLKKLIIKNGFYNFSFLDTVISEYVWLKKRTNKSSLILIANRLFDKDANILRAIDDIFEKSFSFDRICNLDNALKNFKNKNRVKSSIYANFIFIKNSFKNKIFNFRILNNQKKRINPRGGLIVAIIGSDGAGKSTLIKNLTIEFKRKINVKKIYLGLPKNYLFRFFSKFGFKAILNLLIKKSKLNKAIKFKNSGLLVLCDRFPQSKYYNIMDGPLVSSNSNTKNFIKKWFSIIENKEYENMYNTKIDILIKLMVNKETSFSRGSITLELAEKKINVINALTFSGSRKIFEINSSNTHADDIKRKVMNIIWENIK